MLPLTPVSSNVLLRVLKHIPTSSVFNLAKEAMVQFPHRGVRCLSSSYHLLSEDMEPSLKERVLSLKDSDLTDKGKWTCALVRKLSGGVWNCSTETGSRGGVMVARSAQIAQREEVGPRSWDLS